MKNFKITNTETDISCYYKEIIIWHYNKTLNRCPIWSEVNLRRTKPIAEFRLIPKEK